MEKLIIPHIPRRKSVVTMALSILLLFTSRFAEAQNRWSLDIRSSVNIATKKLGNADSRTGYGLEGTFSYRFMTHLGFYAGWSRNRFFVNESFAGVNVDFKETGYTYGLLFVRPLWRTSKTDFSLRIGALSDHIELENNRGDIIADSGHGFGWQIETGLAIPFVKKWQVHPSIRYRSLDVITINLVRDIKNESGSNWSL